MERCDESRSHAAKEAAIFVPDVLKRADRATVEFILLDGTFDRYRASRRKVTGQRDGKRLGFRPHLFNDADEFVMAGDDVGAAVDIEDVTYRVKGPAVMQRVAAKRKSSQPVINVMPCSSRADDPRQRRSAPHLDGTSTAWVLAKA